MAIVVKSPSSSKGTERPATALIVLAKPLKATELISYPSPNILVDDQVNILYLSHLRH